MPDQSSIFTSIGSEKNLIVVFEEIQPSYDVTDEWWTVKVYIPARYEFKGNWEPDFEDSQVDGVLKQSAILRQIEFRQRFEKMIVDVWSPQFSLHGMERSFMLFRKTVRCFIEFRVLNVESDNLETWIGEGWTYDYLRKSKNRIAVIEVYPGTQTGAHKDPLMLLIRIAEDLTPVRKAAYEDEPSPEYQIEAAHEMGHLLGLNHSSCVSSEPGCYGASGTTKNQSIMGRGMEATSSQMKLFKSIMENVAFEYDWSIWRDLIAILSHLTHGRRDGFNFPTGTANLPGPLGSFRN